MEKREPPLVPEWLRSSGNGSGARSSDNHLVSSSSSRSDSSSLAHNRYRRSKSDVGSVRSPSLDRSYSTNARRGFSNGSSTKHTYTNFNVTRGNRYREKERVSHTDPWDDDTCPPLRTLSIGRDQEQLRRSQSMTMRKQEPTMGFKNGRNNYYKVKGIKKPGFDKDSPLIRDQDAVRILSPGWTSALAEVPNVIEKTSVESYTCRNMAEALVKAPSTTGPPPQDRAVQQWRPLIPVVPSAPKISALNSSDKSKAKPVIRSGEIGLPSSRYTHQQSSMLLASQMKPPDTSKKLVILKPAASQMTAAPSTMFTSSLRSTNGPRELMVAGKPAHTQSRNAFYRALKQNTSSTHISTDPSEASSCIVSPVEEKANIIKEVVVTNPSSTHAAERDDIIMERVEKASQVAERSNNGFEFAERPDEKEAEFLRSLGWEENNSEEDEALTQEEINAFMEQYMKSKPSLVQTLPIIQEARGDVTPNS